MGESIWNAFNLKVRGWVWRALQEGPSFTPPCFATEAEQGNCCSRGAGINGNRSCWWDILNFERCCPGARRGGAWILPSPQEARERLKGASDEFCWSVIRGDFESAPLWK